MNWSGIGALFLAIAVGLGAFGAHGLRGQLDAYSMNVYEKAVFYHFIHALGMLVTPVVARSATAGNRVVWLLTLGILLFSGSLYVLVLTGVKTLGIVTPFGGAAFIGAWVLLAWDLFQNSDRSRT